MQKRKQIMLDYNIFLVIIQMAVLTKSASMQDTLNETLKMLERCTQ